MCIHSSPVMLPFKQVETDLQIAMGPFCMPEVVLRPLRCAQGGRASVCVWQRAVVPVHPHFV